MAEGPGGERDETRAAGAVLWRHGAAEVEIALVHRPRYGDWSFPKGKRMPGEHVLITAVREVAEETGIRVVLGRRLSTTRYTAGGRPKRVDYWAAWLAPAQQAAGPPGRAVAIPGPVPNAEVDEVAWLSLDTALGRLSYDRDAEVLKEFAAGPAGTTPLIFLRHAAAISRTAWSDAGELEDLDRPLSPAGLRQADLISKLLSCFPRAHVVSSAAERCLASVRPYAAQAGTVVETEPAFTLEPGRPSLAGGWTPTSAARRRIADAVAGGRPVIVCGHRENLPWLLETACRRLGAPVPAGPPLRTGAFWVLQASERRLISAEQHQLDENT